MAESRSLREATSQKLQTNNWKRLCITYGRLKRRVTTHSLRALPGSKGNLSTESPTIFPSVYMAQVDIAKVRWLTDLNKKPPQIKWREE